MSLCFALTLELSLTSSIHYHDASALARIQTPASLMPSSMPQKFALYEDPADGISIQYPSDWEKIQYFQSPLQMSTAGYRVVVNFLAPIVNASDQWREYLMIQVGNQNIVKNLVPQAKITLAGNPAYKLVYSNDEETFHLKTLEAWTTIGGNTYLLIYKAEATKYPSYLPIIQRMLDSFKVGGGAGLLTNKTMASMGLTNKTMASMGLTNKTMASMGLTNKTMASMGLHK
ncbi:MAG: hypothetical protein WA323_17835 [Candidatus Nitrosopolaris sp.]